MINTLESDILRDINPAKRKRNFLSLPYNLLLLFSLSLLILPLFFWGQGLYIYFSNIALFIPANYFICFLSAIFFLYLIIYKLSSRILFSEYLSWIHVSLSVAFVSYYILTSIWFLKMSESDNMKSHLLKEILNSKVKHVYLNSWKGIIFLSGQFIFVINLAGGLLKKIVANKQRTH